MNKIEEYTNCMGRERFRALWLRCMKAKSGVNEKIIDAIYDDLDNHYSAPDRYYHDWNHVFHCLRESDRVLDLMEFPDALEMAIWFHDVIFSPDADNNEELSANFFSQLSKDFLSHSFIDRVYSLIVITKHQYPPNEGDESLIVDIDLSSFGLPWPDYLTDTHNVRKEQKNKPDAVFFPMHAIFLNKLLSRPRIFTTHFFYERYEETARQNIRKLLNTDMYMKKILELD